MKNIRTNEDRVKTEWLSYPVQFKNNCTVIMQISHSRKCRDLHNGEQNSSQLCLSKLTGFLHFNCVTHCKKMIPLSLFRVKYMLGNHHFVWFVCFWKPTLSCHKIWYMCFFKEKEINAKLGFLHVSIKNLTGFTYCITVLVSNVYWYKWSLPSTWNFYFISLNSSFFDKITLCWCLYQEGNISVI